LGRPGWTRAVGGQSCHPPRGETSELGRSITDGNRSVAAEVGDDESRVADRVCREGGCELTGYSGTQSLGCLTDRKREGCVLLNVSEVCHRIPMPWWGRALCDPRLGGAGHGASSTDSRLPVVAVVLCGLGCREFLFNQRCWCHEAKSFRYLCPSGRVVGHCDELKIRSASCCLQS
jgi:hypothetical protein